MLRCLGVDKTPSLECPTSPRVAAAGAATNRLTLPRASSSDVAETSTTTELVEQRKRPETSRMLGLGMCNEIGEPLAEIVSRATHRCGDLHPHTHTSRSSLGSGHGSRRHLNMFDVWLACSGPVERGAAQAGSSITALTGFGRVTINYGWKKQRVACTCMLGA